MWLPQKQPVRLLTKDAGSVRQQFPTIVYIGICYFSSPKTLDWAVKVDLYITTCQVAIINKFKTPSGSMSIMIEEPLQYEWLWNLSLTIWIDIKLIKKIKELERATVSDTVITPHPIIPFSNTWLETWKNTAI